MAGELRGESVIVEDPAAASTIHNKGSYGEPRSGGVRAAASAYDQFEIKYVVYRDLRQRGYVAVEGPGLPDFHVFPRGGAPGRTPAKFWVLAISARAGFGREGR